MKQLEIFPTSVKTESRKTIAMRNGDIHADSAIRGFDKNTRITGLTNGAFSLISLIRSVLKKTGAAHIVVSTWSSGFYDSNVIDGLLQSNSILSFKFILDRSFKTRQEKYATHITHLFSPENIRTTNTHSKFVLIWNENWNVCIRSSMNLNENKRCENFDLDNDIDIFNLFKNYTDELFAKQPEGIIENRRVVDSVFDSMFETENPAPEQVAPEAKTVSNILSKMPPVSFPE